jgi:hypothetical protein
MNCDVHACNLHPGHAEFDLPRSKRPLRGPNPCRHFTFLGSPEHLCPSSSHSVGCRSGISLFIKRWSTTNTLYQPPLQGRNLTGRAGNPQFPTDEPHIADAQTHFQMQKRKDDGLTETLPNQRPQQSCVVLPVGRRLRSSDLAV